MKQTGTFHVYEVKDNQRVISPIANAFIYFIAGGAIKLKTQTDDKGKYNFDLPLGEYTVASASEGGIEQLLANGSKFILTAQSTEKAFEEWVNAPSADVDSALLKRFKELAKISEDAAREANEVLSEMTDNSIGDGKWTRKTYVDAAVNKKWDKEEGIIAVNKKWDIQTTTGSGNITRMTEVQKKWDIQQTLGSGKVLREKAFGIGISVSRVSESATDLSRYGSGFESSYEISMENKPLNTRDGILLSMFDPSKNWGGIVYIDNNGRLFVRRLDRGIWANWLEFYSQFNTTVDSNGFIKKASPIIKLFNDRIETNDQFYDEPVFEKIGVGTYKISNTKGLSKDGWTYEKPRGGDGTPYFRIEVTKLEDGCIISVHDEYDSIEEATITDIDGNTRKINKVVKVLSQARDIKPHERWIDLRFHEEPREEIESSEVVQ